MTDPSQDPAGWDHDEVPVAKPGTCATCKWFNEPPEDKTQAGACFLNPPVAHVVVLDPPEVPASLLRAGMQVQKSLQTFSVRPAVFGHEACSQWTRDEVPVPELQPPTGPIR